MKTLIKNGTIVTESCEYVADILIEGEKIIAIGINLDTAADITIDASGKYVMPGGVDQHTHFEALCNSGDRDTAGYETTKAVILGGTTTIVDFAPQDPGQGLIHSIENRINVRAKDKIYVDFALHALVTEVSDKLFEEVLELPRYGVSSVKLFMAYKGSPLHVDDGTLYKMLVTSKDAGVTVYVHAENADVIDRLQRDCVLAGNTAPKYHAVSRPPFVEGEATRRALYLARQADAPLFLVHMSCKDAVQAMLEYQANFVRVLGEVTTHHLIGNISLLDNPEFDKAAQFVCSPALRETEETEYMWNSLAKGKISAVVSDHCGIDVAELKQVGRSNFVDIPNGSPGAADRFNMVWSHGVAKGRITRQRFVETVCTNPAKLNGIYPRKGSIGIGSDADIVIFDPDYRGVVRLNDNPNGVDYNIYEGHELIGRPETVLLRGEIVVSNGNFVGKAGQGKYIECKPYSASFTGL